MSQSYTPTSFYAARPQRPPRRLISSAPRPRTSGTRSTYQPNERLFERHDYQVHFGDNEEELDDHGVRNSQDHLFDDLEQQEPLNGHPVNEWLSLLGMLQDQQENLRKMLSKQDELTKLLDENNKRVKVFEENMKKINETTSNSSSPSERKKRVITKDLTVRVIYMLLDYNQFVYHRAWFQKSMTVSMKAFDQMKGCLLHFHL